MTKILDLTHYLEKLIPEFDEQDVVRFLRPLQARLQINTLHLLACNRYMHAWLQQHQDKLLACAKKTISAHIINLDICIDDGANVAHDEQEFKQRLSQAGIAPQYQTAN